MLRGRIARAVRVTIGLQRLVGYSCIFKQSCLKTEEGSATTLRDLSRFKRKKLLTTAKMSVGEFTVSNIAMEEDKREDQQKKKATIDMTKLTADIAAQKELAKQGKLHQAVEALLNLEKISRLGEDITATKACCSAVLEVCFEAKDWKLLEEQLTLLAKRRSQLKQIFVEIERARLTRKLAVIKEQEGNINEAADTLQEVAVETFGAMAKTEKIAFILEQVRLCLDKQDYIRAQILSRKISPKAFVERKGEGKGEIGIEGTAIEAPEEGVPSLPELKLNYYQLMIRYYSHYNNYLEMCRCYRAIYETEAVSADKNMWMPILKKICWFIVLSPSYSTAEGSSSDRLTLLTTTLQDKKLADVPAYKTLLTTYHTSEIIRWSAFQQQYAGDIAAETEVFGDNAQRIADLRLRVMEHNVLVVAKYYVRIKTSRLSELLDLSPEESEKHLSDLVVAKAISAKVDRPAGIVRFGRPQEPEDLLNGWASNIRRLLDLVEKSCQQIQKEAMVHQVTMLSSSAAS